MNDYLFKVYRFIVVQMFLFSRPIEIEYLNCRRVYDFLIALLIPVPVQRAFDKLEC